MATDGIESWLDELSAALAPLPRGDREEILAETRSHIADRWGPQDDPAVRRAVVEDLGPPREYARGFLENYDLGETENRRRRTAARVSGAVALVAAAVAGLLALQQVLTIPPSTPGWLTWRDVTLGERGWISLLVAWAIVAVVLAVAGRRLWRWGKEPEESSTRGGPERG